MHSLRASSRPKHSSVIEIDRCTPGADSGSRRIPEYFRRVRSAVSGHTSIGPAHALADPSDGAMTIYSNDIESYGLRTGVAKFLDLPRDKVRVVYMDGPQVYGRTAADDAGFEAAFLAKELRRPASGGAATPSTMYAIANRRTTTRVVALPMTWETPLRTGNLRDPHGSQVTFAFESFIDELAAAAGADPVQCRLELLEAAQEDDVFRKARSLATLCAAAKAYGWETRPSPRPRAATARGKVLAGRGIAYTYRSNTIATVITGVEKSPASIGPPIRACDTRTRRRQSTWCWSTAIPLQTVRSAVLRRWRDQPQTRDCCGRQCNLRRNGRSIASGAVSQRAGVGGVESGRHVASSVQRTDRSVSL